jgi:hypothetical protein
MARYVFVLVAMLSLGVSASSPMFPRSLSVQFGDLSAPFPFSTELSVRQLIGTEVGLGYVKFYHYEQLFNNTSRMCIEADWQTLSRLQQAIGKQAQSDDTVRVTEVSLSTIGCTRDERGQPEPR